MRVPSKAANPSRGSVIPCLFNEQFFGTSKHVDRSRIHGATHATSQTDARQFFHKP